MSPFVAFVRVLLLFTGFAFIGRIVFAIYHTDLGAELSVLQLAATLVAGLRFDLAIAAALAFFAYFPAYALNRITRFSFITTLRRLGYIAISALVLVHGADLLYFDETGRHLGYEIKEAYQSSGELLSAAVTTYTRVVIVHLVLLVLAWVAMYFVVPSPDPRQRRMFAPHKRWYQHFAPEAQLVMVFIAAVLLTRGGLQSVPLEPLHAQTLGDPQRAALALNGAYNATFSAVTPYAVDRVLSATPSVEQHALVAAMYPPAPALARVAAATPPPNIVIVFLESWSARYMASYGHSAVTTPFFDELRNRSFTTRDMLAGGHRTTEGLFATLCSAQNPLGATVAQSQLQNYRYDCLPKLLKQHGYQNAFFQGTVSGTSGTGAFAQLLGFEQSYGKEHVSQYRLPHNTWGLHDPDVYAFTLEKIETLTPPFLVGINSNSTHDHQLPPDAPTPFDPATPEGRYSNVLHFADGALREFVTTLTARHPNTILVLVADHAGPGMGPAINRYRIPFLIHAPGRLAPTTVDGVATQRDVAPTLLQVLGMPQAPWFTGHSLAGPHALQADYYHAGVLGWIEGDLGVELPVRQAEAARCFVPRGEFAPMPCTPNAPEAAKRAMALTTVLQDLLFQGRLTEFRATASGPR